jgi:hypothetical protein
MGVDRATSQESDLLPTLEAIGRALHGEFQPRAADANAPCESALPMRGDGWRRARTTPRIRPTVPEDTTARLRLCSRAPRTGRT